jgi:drug/metabolite transporter (DMT)-like permease
MHGVVRHLSTEIPVFEMVFFRHLFGLIVLLPWMGRVGFASLRSERLSLHAVRAALGIAGIVTWFYGLALVPLAEATALNFLSTVFTSIFAVLFLGEVMGGRRWIALGIGFAGAAVLLRPGVEAISLGSMVIILSSVLWAVTLVILKRLSGSDRSSAIVFNMYLFMTLFSLIPALVDWRWPSPTDLAWLALMGTVGTAGHLALAKAFQLADASALMPIDFTRLIWAAVIGFLAFAEIPDRWTWIGGGMIFAAGLLSGRAR